MKDLVGVGLISTLLFPIILLVILVMKGVVNFQVGMAPEAEEKVKQYVEPLTEEQLAADAEQGPEFEAAKKKAEEAKKAAEDLKQERERLEQVKAENQQLLAALDSSKAKMGAENDAEEAESKKKLESLAQIYGAMKPVEAAPILLNLSDVKISQIMAKIPETRQQGKLLAAMGALNQERAAEVSRLIGYKKEGSDAPPTKPKAGGK